MKVLSIPLGRFGNAIFRHFASTLFCILYGAQRVQQLHDVKEPVHELTDAFFIQWMEQVLQGNIPKLDPTHLVGFHGFFQHDRIYVEHRAAILEYMRNNPQDLIMTDGKSQQRPDIAYQAFGCYAIDLLRNPDKLRTYDVVVHLRLGDFIDLGKVIHPQSVVELLQLIHAPSYCVVVDAPKNDLERMYLDYLRDRFTIRVESNDPFTDFHILRNAKTLVCCESTLAWAAAFLSETLTTLYMPQMPKRQPHETFTRPIANTQIYTYTTCTKDELTSFFANLPPEPAYKDNMIIPTEHILKILKHFNLDITGVLHIGAHECEEMTLYKKMGLTPKDIVWMDAIPTKVEEARQRLIPNVYHALVTDQVDVETTLHISNNVQSSSILNLKTHLTAHPGVHFTKDIVVKSTTIDTFFERNKLEIPKYNFWNIDIQGAELKALLGGEICLKFAKALYLEVNEEELYEGCPLKPALDYYLSSKGFTCVAQVMWGNCGWGDALYVRTH